MPIQQDSTHTQLVTKSKHNARSNWSLAARLMRRRRLIAAAAALPLFQATGCFPDPIGAFNFELQSLINSVLIQTVTTIVENVLRL
jgi:hypothetical protein